ncbi:hypothetical protein [Streptomyces sp. NPDC089919]|uniref:hypothetical protein n=1 Tax=Streptomyces sp. NPDC089919 TaxID=3155188 RepID=UPI003419478B
MIDQAYVQADDKTTPAVKDIRERIATAVDATTGTALARLTCWLQMPQDVTFAKMVDPDCKPRATRVGGLLSGEGGLYEPADLSVALGVPAKWAAIDKALAADRAVFVSGSTGHVGGDKSKFLNDRGTGFHVIVFLAVGKESDGRVYYLGLDPDVSATKESREAWEGLVKVKSVETKPADFTAEKSVELVKAMILGTADGGFGPLVRKYYVDTTKAFPKVLRG